MGDKKEPPLMAGNEVVKHVILDGSRRHVESYTTDGVVCSESNCEMNQPLRSPPMPNEEGGPARVVRLHNNTFDVRLHDVLVNGGLTGEDASEIAEEINYALQPLVARAVEDAAQYALIDFQRSLVEEAATIELGRHFADGPLAGASIYNVYQWAWLRAKNFASALRSKKAGAEGGGV